MRTMEKQLEILKASIDLLDTTALPAAGRKGRITKTDRLKAVTFVHDFIAKKATISALTAASKYEMITGPPDDSDTPSLYLGWAGLVKTLLITLRDACDDALNSKAATTSGLASIKPDYMRSFRRAMTLAIKHGPPCAISPIVPAFLAFAHDCLREPPLRKVLADDIWQCVRILIQPEPNRAVLTTLIIRAWSDNCFQQLTGRGPVYHSSATSTSLAGDVFQLLATPTESYDVLTQSTRGIAPSKMVGGDFGYAIICERACLMIALSETMPRRKAQELQQVAFRILTIALSDHALDVIGSSALEAIIRVAVTPILTCWSERKYHAAAVSFARILLFIAPNNSKLQDGIRRRVRADVTDATASAIVRAGQDVRDDYIDVCAACFSLREALEFASAPNALQGHVIVWLRVASAILSGHVLKLGTSVLVDVKDLFDQCTRAAEVVCNLLKSQSNVRANSFAEVIHYGCVVVNSSVTIANHVLTEGFKFSPLDCTAYSNLFCSMRELVTTLAYAGKAPGYSMSAVGLKPDESLIQSLTLLSGCVLIDHITLQKPLQTKSQGSSELSFPLPHILSSASSRSSLLAEVQFFRNLVSRCGFSDEDGTGLRYRLVIALINLCKEEHSAVVSPEIFAHASSVVLALTRGQCPLIEPSAVLKSLHQGKKPLNYPLSALFRTHLVFGLSAEPGEISLDGPTSVQRFRDQDIINRGRELHVFLNDEECSIQSSLVLRTIVPDPIDNLTRHFAIDPILSAKLVSQMLADLVNISEKALERRGPINAQRTTSGGQSPSFQFTDLNSMRSGLSVLVFASNYLSLGIQHGLIWTRDGGAQGESAFVELAALVCNLATALRNMDLNLLDKVPELVKLSLHGCCKLINALESKNDSTPWSNNSPWKTVLRSLPSELSEFSAALCDFFVVKALQNAKKSRDRIRAYVNQQLEDPFILEQGSVRQKKRSRSRGNPKLSRKRQRTVFSSPESNSSDDREGFPGDSDHERNDIEERDSDVDDFGDETSESIRSVHGMHGGRSIIQTGKLKLISELVILLVKSLPVVREVVLECCKNGLKAIKAVESVLSPDGFERASLYTSLVDPAVIEARSYIWKILLAISTTPSLLEASDDVWNVGRYWKNLEAIGQDYSSYYNFSMSGEGKKRKHYPLSLELEHTRILFLDVACLFLKHIQLNFSTQPREISIHIDQVRRKIAGFIDIAEFFRIRHAFRMPRRVRLSYLRFGRQAINVLNKGLLAETTSFGTEDIVVPISDKVSNILSALCKLLNDSEAIVRVEAAKVVPKVFASWERYKLAEVERVFDECLPGSDVCFDPTVKIESHIPQANNEMSSMENEFDLEQRELQTFCFLRDSFHKVGAYCKGLTAFVGIGEMSALREDVVPFLFKQVMLRLKSQTELLCSAFSMMCRLCLVHGHKSPHYFYRVFSRAILPRIFTPPLSPNLILSFPVILAIDENHHEEGVLFDWLREEQAIVLPHLLVHDDPATLPVTTKFAESIGTNLKDLLLDNPSSVVRVYPMLFSPALKALGEKLWCSINSVFDGKLMVELAKKKDEVISGFLTSASANFFCMHSSNDRKFDIERCKGFSRDTNALNPPYYDPLIVATTIDHMYSSSSDTSILPSHVLCGSLFGQVRCEQNGALLTKSFPGFVRECRRQSSTTLLRCLLTIAKALDPALTCQTSFNRIDAFFSVGVVWLMLGREILMKGSVERLLFYKLVSFGFYYSETAWDAAWLLSKIQQELLNVEKQSETISIDPTGIVPLSPEEEHLNFMTGLQEKHFYEILSAFSPTLVSAVTAEADRCNNQLCNNALASLKRLLSSCVREGLWRAILCNGPFPGGKLFKEVRQVYSCATEKAEGEFEGNFVEKTLSSLRRFRGVFHLQNKSHVKIKSLSCLRELKTMLTDSNVASLSKHIANEAWLRTDGQVQPSSNLIGSFVASLIQLLRFISAGNSGARAREPFDVASSFSYTNLNTKNRLEKQILYSVSDVLNALGLVNQHSVPFINVRPSSKSIPSKHVSGKYEDVQDGIARSFFSLILALQSDSSIAAESAMNSLTAMLHTSDGKALLRSRKDISKLSYFRGSERKASAARDILSDVSVANPRNGDRVLLSSLPALDDPLLWNLSISMRTENGDYEPWVRQLCTVLALNCRSDANKALAGACFGSFQFSCDVMPYLLMDVICDLGPEGHASVSTLILEHVLRKSDTSSNVLRIFVHALDVLCQIGLEIGDGKNFTSRVQKTSTGSLFIPYVYVLDIPYSDAVKVCLKCGASFSAIRYCHMYVDHKVLSREHTRDGVKDITKDNVPEKRYSSCPYRDPSVEEAEQSSLHKVKPWMREAMMQLFETDGVRAFALSEKLGESSVNVANIDEDWSRSFASLGVVSRVEGYSAVSDTSSTLSMGDRNFCGVDLLTEHDTFRSLIGIGNLSVAIQYWDGLLCRVTKNGLRNRSDPIYSNQSLIDRMNDLRYAAAWKLEHWESPSLLPTAVESDSSKDSECPNFHETIYHVLHLLKTNRMAESPSLFLSARSRLLNDLCRDTFSVSAQQVLEVSAQLRVLHVLEKTGPGPVSITSHASDAPSWMDPQASQREVGPCSQLPQTSGNVEDLLTSLGVKDIDDQSSNIFRDIFSSSILVEDLPVTTVKSIGLEKYIAQVAAFVSARILEHGDSGSWARSASSLGTKFSAFVSQATELDQVAWKLQDCVLRWSASDDARLRKQALSIVKDIIFLDLGGQACERSDENSNADNSSSSHHALAWVSSQHGCRKEAFLRSEACRLAAQWSLDTRTHEPLDLFHTYLEPGLQAVVSSTDPKLRSRAHHAMAKFADIQIANIDKYRRSRKYEEMVTTIRDAQGHIERLQAMKESGVSAPRKSKKRTRLSSVDASGVDKVVSDIDYFIRINMKQISMDKSRLEKLNDVYKKWQVLACEHYAACLRYGSIHDLHSAFRMVALWLDSGDMRNTITCRLNGQDDTSTLDQAILVPLEKLLPLAPQLFSRLDHSEMTVFQRTLATTVVELSGAHPAHCLWPLLALTNAQRTSGTEEEKLSSLYRGNKHKKDAAIEILGRLKAKHGDTVLQMKKVADAYIALSEISGRQKRSGLKMDISKYNLLKLGQLSEVAVPTVPLPLRATSYCDNLPTIAGFDKMATVCAGLSKPLKVKCIGSDGVLYSQMVKGRDDLRGDAVMEQLFTIMNSLLEQDVQACRRNLHIRTYRIVPLSPFSGIMQFVSNTMQFKELLVEGQDSANGNGRGKQKTSERGRLHERYRPHDLKNFNVADRAFDEYKRKFSLQKRLNYLRVVWKRLQPVFRYFFLEEWPDASEWFTHQLAYSRSTAVISIVGFILGLGDRHLSNILVDVQTGEVVHIDFGIAFEQGKLLPQPEHMPFRLTRDLVDGFGISGVEGVFRKSCEITLSVMRRHKDVLLTVVEVLLHDPMFNWGLTPEDVLREQLDPKRGDEVDDDSSPGDSSFEEIALKVDRSRKVSGSREAHRALNRISEKLDGLEGTERLSVEAHVGRLIDEAQAFHVIAPVYPGWAPWL